MGLDQQHDVIPLNASNGQFSDGLTIVSNRLPVVLSKLNDGTWDAKPGSGGLVHSLKHALRERHGLWLGWSGAVDGEGIDEALARASAGAGYSLRGISLTADQIENYYFGFSNEVIWPLFHDMVSRCRFHPRYWTVYQQVNQHFAEEVDRIVGEDDFVWIQDYHLMMVAWYLQHNGSHRKTGFFLHIPFPPLDIFMKLPWRFEILRALLAHNAIGFQSVRDTRNFIQCVENLFSDVQVARQDDAYTVIIDQSIVSVGNFPIGIDFEGFDSMSRASDVKRSAALQRKELSGRKLILGIDRLDYTKGIPERLYAFQSALRRYPELIEKVTFTQIVVPSRDDIFQYQRMKEEVEQLVSKINGEFTRTGWVPVHYIYRSLGFEDLVSQYRASHISFVTPLKDGMNLIAKEYVAANVEEDGVLILSEFAGAAAQLQHGAILVNPHDVIGTAEAIHQSFVMDRHERQMRMAQLRDIVRETDVFWWTSSFLNMALNGVHDLNPDQAFYVPQSDIGNVEIREFAVREVVG